jgi:predicted SAM-dependent methyltransferase
MKSLLNVGGGGISALGRLVADTSDWKETHYDLSTERADIVGSIFDIPDRFALLSYDGVVASHVIEHLPNERIIEALRALMHPLHNGGFVAVFVPDMESVAEAIVSTGSLRTEMYKMQSGEPVRAIDMVYGYTLWTENDPLMAHKTGFTTNDLAAAILQAGGKIERIQRMRESFEVMAVFK